MTFYKSKNGNSRHIDVRIFFRIFVIWVSGWLVCFRALVYLRAHCFIFLVFNLRKLLMPNPSGVSLALSWPTMGRLILRLHSSPVSFLWTDSTNGNQSPHIFHHSKVLLGPPRYSLVMVDASMIITIRVLATKNLCVSYLDRLILNDSFNAIYLIEVLTWMEITAGYS